MNASEHFKWSELQCPCCGIRNIQSEAIRKLELLRVSMGVPLIINSAARCPAHNSDPKVGGGLNSQHLSIEETQENEGRESTAFDIHLGTIDKQELIDKAVAAGFKGIGVNYNSFVHVDNRERKARW